MYTLYVSKDKNAPERLEVGSVLCVALIEEFLSQNLITVVHIESPKHRPSWLLGTPSLKDSATNEVFKGFAAVLQLQRIAVNRAYQRGKEERPPPAAPKAVEAKAEEPKKPGPLAPALQLRPEVSQTEQDDSSDMPTSALWTTQIPDGDQQEESTGKLTGDDLAKAIQERQRTTMGNTA